MRLAGGGGLKDRSSGSETQSGREVGSDSRSADQLGGIQNRSCRIKNTSKITVGNKIK